MAARKGKAITPFEERVLRDYFTSHIKACGADPQAYDFNAELDHNLTYYENKQKFQGLIDQACGTQGVARERYEAQAREYEPPKIPEMPATQLQLQEIQRYGGEERPGMSITEAQAEINRLIKMMLSQPERYKQLKREKKQEQESLGDIDFF